MDRFIIYLISFILWCASSTYADNVVVVIPSKQIRRSPILPVRNVPISPYSSYMSTKYPSLNYYGSIRSGTNVSPSNQVPHSLSDYTQNQNGVNYPVMPYGKGVNYPVYGRGYASYDKMKGGLVPLANQKRYPQEASKSRPQIGLPYGPISTISGYYKNRPIGNDPYLTDLKSPAKIKLHQHKPISIYQAQASTIVGHRYPDSMPAPPQKNQQLIASSIYPTKLGPIVVKATRNPQQEEATRTGDLLKDSSNAIGKVPPASTAVAGKGEIVLRDTVSLVDYEKKIAEFTKSWPKLSAFPGALGSASAFFPGSSSNSNIPLTNGARKSVNLETSNSIGRQGYEVKEEVDEPPVDFKSTPIIVSPLQHYPPPPTSLLSKKYLG